MIFPTVTFGVSVSMIVTNSAANATCKVPVAKKISNTVRLFSYHQFSEDVNEVNLFTGILSKVDLEWVFKQLKQRK